MVQEPVKVELADVTVSKQKGTVVFKAPGSIRGNPFQIEECTDCDIYVLDLTATVTIDECVNCRIFIGPCESSIFVRDCKDCKFTLACQQYRSRSCLRCDTLLMCTTAPVVESSKEMRFGCWRTQYFDLKEQLDGAGLDVYQNKWSEVYDFTKADGNWCGQRFFVDCFKVAVYAISDTCALLRLALVGYTWQDTSARRNGVHRDAAALEVFTSDKPRGGAAGVGRTVDIRRPPPHSINHTPYMRTRARTRKNTHTPTQMHMHTGARAHACRHTESCTCVCARTRARSQTRGHRSADACCWVRDAIPLCVCRTQSDLDGCQLRAVHGQRRERHAIARRPVDTVEWRHTQARADSVGAVPLPVALQHGEYGSV